MATARKPAQSDLDATRALLSQLGLEWVSQGLPELLERAVTEELTLPRFLHLVCQREQESREERRVRTGLKLSGLPVGEPLESFDFAFQRSVDRSQIDLPATSEFVRRQEVVLLLGPPGVGKSHLAAGLGVKAVQHGFSVAFMSADHLVDVVRPDEAADGRRLHRRRYMTTGLLIIDELGLKFSTGATPTCCSRSSTTATSAAAPSSPRTRASASGPRCWPETRSWPPPSSTACCTTATCCRSTGAASACGTWRSSWLKIGDPGNR